MAWTAPRTWVTGETVTAALMNTHVRDNLLETGPAIVTTAGDLTYADGANSLARLAIGNAATFLGSDGSAPLWRQAASDTAASGSAATTTSTSYVDLADDEATVEVTVTTSTVATVLFGATLWNGTAGSRTFLSWDVAGATTLAASDTRAIYFESDSANQRSRMFGAFRVTSLTAGSNTFTLQNRVNSGTGNLDQSHIAVIPI